MLLNAIRKIVLCYHAIRASVWFKINGIEYNSNWRIYGIPCIKRTTNAKIKIGDRFYCVSKSRYNSVGVNQPVMLYATGIGSSIIIGDDVGISGATLSAMKSIIVGDGVLIGSGTLIMDNDAHPVYSSIRRYSNEKIGCEPVVIGNNAFIGARAIILKGVVIGNGCVIGAGSVISQSTPPNTIYAGNPGQFIKYNI